MGVIISAIAIGTKKHKRRKQQKIEENYRPQTIPQSRGVPELSEEQTPATPAPPSLPPTYSSTQQPRAQPSGEQSSPASAELDGQALPHSEGQALLQRSGLAAASGQAGQLHELPEGSNTHKATGEATTNSEPEVTSGATQATELPTDAKMATDEDYMDFLEKANRDPNEGGEDVQTKSGGGKVQLKTVDGEVPQVLQQAVESEDAVYVSDADEVFEAVSLAWEGEGLPDGAAFAKLVDHPEKEQAGVDVLTVEAWDREGVYKGVVGATKKAANDSEVKVYRIELGGVRVEYWVLGVDKEAKRLVGVKALAIES